MIRQGFRCLVIAELCLTTALAGVDFGSGQSWFVAVAIHEEHRHAEIKHPLSSLAQLARVE
jgi:hypothetical protein